MISNNDENIYVITRTGKKELLSTDKITSRIKNLVNMEPKIDHINAHKLMLEVSPGISNLISTYELDEYISKRAASLSLTNPYYLKFAARIAIDNHQKNTKRSFIDKMKDAYLRTDKKGDVKSLISNDFYKFIEKHQDVIEPMIDYKKDFLLDFFGFRTFQRIYSIKINDKAIERPQDAFMRVAIALHFDNDTQDKDFIFKKIKETYNLLSNKLYTQASPMYFNAGTNNPQYSSCFLLGSNDSLEGIKETEIDMAKISKWSGGLGVHINDWRSTDVTINGTNGKSNGIVPFLRMYNNTMRAFNQGGKRLGSCAIYLMPHHPNILEFIKLKRNDGSEEERARDLFYAVWIPDIFMERVRSNGNWSTFDPHEQFDLSNVYGDEYTKKYLEMEKDGLSSSTFKARELWEEIYKSNLQKGMPYVCFSDNANRQSNQNNLGVIKSSNLCAEIYEFSNDKESAVCNLCSINLEACVKEADGVYSEFPVSPKFDFIQLKNIAKTSVYNLNQIIDRNFYPTEKTKLSNERHRPIGVGVQGQANAYMKLRFPFESDDAKKLNANIYETILYGCYTESTNICKRIYTKAVKICKETGKYSHVKYLPNYKNETIVYTDYKSIPKNIGAYDSMSWNGGSHLYNGKLCFELTKEKTKLSNMWDWDSLREHIKIYGMRNSLCVALMPTASTSQFLGNNECFEPILSVNFSFSISTL